MQELDKSVKNLWMDLNWGGGGDGGRVGNMLWSPNLGGNLLREVHRHSYTINYKGAKTS